MRYEMEKQVEIKLKQIEIYGNKMEILIAVDNNIFPNSPNFNLFLSRQENLLFTSWTNFSEASFLVHLKLDFM